MIHRRTALLSGASLLVSGALPFAAKAQSSPQDRADVARIEAYLNGIRTLRAHFMQVASDGGVAQGEAYLSRPGKMRFQYDPPSPFLLVANFGTLFFHDSQLDQTSEIPLNRTPLGILLANRTSLSGDITVTRVARLPGQVQVSMVRTESPGDGSLALLFANDPLTLRQWTVVDPQGKETRVTFTRMEMGISFDPKLFDYQRQGAGPSGGG